MEEKEETRGEGRDGRWRKGNIKKMEGRKERKEEGKIEDEGKKT